jgi:hypothetical protein
LSANTNLLLAAFAGGGRTSRYGDYVVVVLQACAFVTTPMEFMQAQTWARAKRASGRPQQDITTFVDRFETTLARNGCGIATKGNRKVLAGIVKSMKANSMEMEVWNVPQNLDQGVEIVKRKPDEEAAPAVVVAPAAVTPPA